MKKSSGFHLVGIFAIVTFLVIVGLIIWRISSSNNNQTKQTQQTTQQSQVPTKSAPTEQNKPKTKSYTSVAGSFTFAYPEDWTLEASPGGSGEIVTISSPDLKTKYENIGSYTVLQGAKILVSGYGCADKCGLQYVYDDIYRFATKRTSATVDGSPAAQFVFGYETVPTLNTVFYKGANEYSISLDTTGDVTQNPFSSVYNDIVIKSFKVTGN